MVRDKLGRKMSKQLGNSPDPIMLMEQFGADGVRMGMLLSSPAGNDLLFDESLCEQGRNFNNKIWNAFRLIKGWQVDNNIAQPQACATAVKWFNMRLNEVLVEMNDHFDKYRLSDALMAVYKLVWDDFCSCFLEVVKPPYQQPVDGKTYNMDANDKGLKGVAHWYRKQYEEEMEHAFRFVHYLEEQLARVELKPIAKFKTSWKNMAEMFNETLEHEKVVTGLIHKLCDLAAKESAQRNS